MEPFPPYTPDPASLCPKQFVGWAMPGTKEALEAEALREQQRCIDRERAENERKQYDYNDALREYERRDTAWAKGLLPAIATADYWRSWGTVIGWVLAWSTAFWGVAALVGWIVRGFRS